jgi:hypothetical protein
LNNAKYLCSVVKKLGGVIFCNPEDIVNVNPKQMLIMIAVIMQIANEQ